MSSYPRDTGTRDSALWCEDAWEHVRGHGEASSLRQGPWRGTRPSPCPVDEKGQAWGQGRAGQTLSTDHVCGSENTERCAVVVWETESHELEASLSHVVRIGLSK